jgi:hypothetical protein
VIDFRVAVTKNKNGGFSINNYACYLAFFMQRFSFKCEDSKLLDMLSFAFGNLIGMETIQFDYVINEIKDIGKVNERVIENINSHNIAESSIYETHIEFALSNNLKQCYPTIISDLVTSDLKNYQKNSIIDLFFKSHQNISELKNICDELDIEVQLHLFEKLIVTKEKSFVIKKLNSFSNSELDIETMRSVNNLLITTKQILGLEKSIDWIITNKQNPFSQHGQGLSYFEDVKALPFLITLLELSYDSSITSEHSFDRMWSFVVNGLEYLALSSKENYTIVLARMKSFIDENKGKLENVEFLNRPIESIKEKYYNNETIKYDLETAMTKIASLLSI